jgi:replicative DNA helicase
MYDEDIEKTVLYYLIFENEAIEISEEDFFLKKHKQIAKAILELKAQKEEINIISIKNKIEGKDTEILKYISIIAESKYGSSIQYAYKELKRLSKKRKLMNIATEIKEKVLDENEPEIYIEKIIKKLNEINSEGEKEETFLDMLIKTSDMIEKKRIQGTKYDYKYFTGIFDLDKATNGLHEEELTIVGARPGVGKTTFALQVAYKIAEKGLGVGIISLEMSETQIIQKIISRVSNVDSNKLRTGNINEVEREKIAIAEGEISDLPIFINTRIRNIQEIEIYARKLKNKKNLGLLIIDYIQLVKNKNKFNSREQEVADISRTLKLLSLELKIPIIGLCQLNRNAARTEPTLADLRESGAIEQDADNVIFIYKENDEEEQALVENVVIDLQKQRAGGLAKVVVKFDKKVSEFRNLIRR